MKVKCWKFFFVLILGVLKSGAMEAPDRVEGSLPFPKLDLNSSGHSDSYSSYQEPSRYTNFPDYSGGISSYPFVPIPAFSSMPTDGGNLTSLSSQSNSEISIQTSYPSAPLWDPQEEFASSPSQAMTTYSQQPHATLSLISRENGQQLSTQYVTMPVEDYQRMIMHTSWIINEQREMKEMVQILLLKGEEQKEVLERVEQGQEILTTELMTLKGAFVKVAGELTDSRQSGLGKAYLWGKFMFNAGVSVATGATTYTLITPILAFLPAVISPPLAVPIAFAAFSGLKLFTKLV